MVIFIMFGESVGNERMVANSENAPESKHYDIDNGVTGYRLSLSPEEFPEHLTGKGQPDLSGLY